jgi:two-component system sensor histidine kinase KdpD
VLVQLLENAAKYSPAETPITITAEPAGKMVSISVADRGPGIDDMEQSLIFEKFYRGRDQRYRIQGTGMGLAIAKAIVEAHHVDHRRDFASRAAARCFLSRCRLAISN